MLRVMNFPTLNPRILTEMINENKIVFDNTFQRKLCWTIAQKSLLIMSLIEGYRVPEMLANEVNDVYDILDGKQRSNAICDFMNDKYELVRVPKFKHDNKMIDINGMIFSQLPSDIQKTIESYPLTLNFFKNMTEQQIRTQFYRSNNGKVLTLTEKRRVTARSFDIFIKLKRHSLFQTITTTKGKRSKKDEDMVQKAWIISYFEEPSFKDSYITPRIENEEVTKEQKEELEKAFTKIYNVYNYYKTYKNNDPQITADIQRIAKKIKTQTNLVSIVPMAIRANKENRTDEEFIGWIGLFFGINGKAYSNEYSETTTKGTADANVIKRRMEILNESYEEHFEISKNENIEEDEIEEQMTL